MAPTDDVPGRPAPRARNPRAHGLQCLGCASGGEVDVGRVEDRGGPVRVPLCGPRGGRCGPG
eukprot:2234503-Lingulodinium_polyedra.AAC.1